MVVQQDNIGELAWEKMQDLLPAIVQDSLSGKVLMQGYMNQAALTATLESGKATFFSRSRQQLWQKGETSGNTLQVMEITSDCDNDSLLVLAKPTGPTCHTGEESCWFHSRGADYTFLADLERLVAGRKHADPDSSYTAKLYDKGVKRIAQKVGEEGVETALAAAVGDTEELKNEAADLLYHLMVLLQATGLSVTDVVDVLKFRHQGAE